MDNRERADPEADEAHPVFLTAAELQALTRHRVPVLPSRYVEVRLKELRERHRQGGGRSQGENDRSHVENQTGGV